MVTSQGWAPSGNKSKTQLIGPDYDLPMFANWKQSKSKNCWSTCFWSLDKSVSCSFLFCRPDTWKDKRKMKCDQRPSNWGKEDILPYWFWCINEGGHHMSGVFWTSLIVFFLQCYHSLLDLCFQFCCGDGSWSEPSQIAPELHAIKFWEFPRGRLLLTDSMLVPSWGLLCLCASHWLTGACYLSPTGTYQAFL